MNGLMGALEDEVGLNSATVATQQQSRDRSFLEWLYQRNTYPPVIVMGEDALPKKFKRGRFYGQGWTGVTNHEVNYGAIIKSNLGRFNLAAGVFRSFLGTNHIYSDLYANASSEGRASNHIITAAPGRDIGSTSGEVRASYSVTEGDRSHTFTLSMRARDRDREFGGMMSVNFGAAKIGEPVKLEKPNFNIGEKSKLSIDQLAGGLSYQGRWKDVGELTLGLQKTSYRRELTQVGSSTSSMRTSPWLYNAAAAFRLLPKLAVYAGSTRGLEEAPLAPPSAINYDEASPAIITSQVDGGIRWSISPTLTAISGLFEVKKPYYQLDNQRMFRRLGDVRHRGAELSLTGQVTKNLRVVLGAILLDAELSGEPVDSGLLGKRPVQSRKREFILSADYQLPWLKGLSLDMNIYAASKLTANSANTVFTPAAEFVNVSGRYHFVAGKIPVSLRLTVQNLFNEYAWFPVASNAYFYTQPRTAMVKLAADF